MRSLDNGRTQKWYTLEDVKTSFSLFCCVYGIGTLGMPANFARAGPIYATFALIFMAIANIYASIALSNVFLVAPAKVKTYADIGEWIMGKPGRFIAITSQIAVCFLIPCAFLVLGGDLLQVISNSDFSRTFWIIIMTAFVLPVCLIPTLKEGAAIAFIGCLATILSDGIALGVLMHEMNGHPTAVPAPRVNIHEILTTFGNLSLAYGVGNVIPTLQRQHSQPHHMPRVIFLTLLTTSILFFVVASTGYSVAGCQMSGNLLFTISDVNEEEPHKSNSPSLLGFNADSTAVFFAFLFMQMHITIAFSVILHPAFYVFERIFLKMHRNTPSPEDKKDVGTKEATISTQVLSLSSNVQGGSEKEIRINSIDDARIQVVEVSNGVTRNDGLTDLDISTVSENKLAVEEMNEYCGKRTIAAVVLLRFIIVAMLALISVALQDHFFELSDFIGASAITLSCLVLPLLWYLCVFWSKLRWIERLSAIAIVVICSLIAVYVIFTTGKTISQPLEMEVKAADIHGVTERVKFKYCKVENQIQPYFIRETEEH